MKKEQTVNGVGSMESIKVYNARENNLKGIDVEIPIGQLTCVIGPSGCGKSSLVFDTIYAESQRNMLESMAGNRFGQKLMDKPKVDRIDYLRPALNLSQSYHNVNPRSTIGTLSDISYYLRTMYALIYSNDTGKNVDMNVFSANHPSSVCQKCEGSGEMYVISEKLIVPDGTKTLEDGAILFYHGGKNSMEHKLLLAICEYFDIDPNTRFQDLSKEEIDHLLYRTDMLEFSLRFKTKSGRSRNKSVHSLGVIPELKKKLEKIQMPSVLASISKYLMKVPCSDCGGQKLRNEFLAVRLCGKNISEAEEMSLDELMNWCQAVRDSYEKTAYASQLSLLIEEMESRIRELILLDVGYLSLNRSVPSLSRGEVQRIRVATQLHCSLSGLLYIMDEPCRGLHLKNVDSVIKATKKLVKKGNTVLAIEHHQQYVSSADYLIEMGKGGGKEGGILVYEGRVSSNISLNNHIKKRKESNRYIELCNINYRNLKDLSIKIPVGSITCITGVSGAGKSSLAHVIFESCLTEKPVHCEKLVLPEKINHVVKADQNPIGKTSRSTVVSYLGIYDTIREIFADQEESKKRLLSATDFSMNVSGGRCEECMGSGKKKVELQYLGDSYIECPVCKGNRFSSEILEISVNGYTINDILNLSAESAKEVFKKYKKISTVLDSMIRLGIGYLSLGQMSMYLSGGEAQRIKLAKALSNRSSGKGLYLLDEPTAGLHESDTKKIAQILNELADAGNTIVLVEHNPHFISANADYVVDLGNEAGNKRGETIIQGSFQQVLHDKRSSWNSYVDLFVEKDFTQTE